MAIIVLAGMAIAPAVAQDESEYIKRPFQITLLPPLGSNGPDYQDCVNRISLNLLWGESAGLKGLELGGLANFERDFVEGVQFAGFGNFNRGTTLGLSASGFINTDNGLNGASVAGFMTISRRVRGLQGSGFMNISGPVAGAQIAGFMNLAAEASGAQLSSFMNVSANMTGGQAAGFMNIAETVKGAQTAGFINIAEDVTGAQVSGFMNIAGDVKGTQVGFINIADHYESGVPIGFLSLVEDGYQDFEVATSETWNLSVGYRVGVDRLYTQFFLGKRWEDPDDFWGFGAGIGTRFPVTHYFKGSVDLISWQLVEGDKLWAPRPNLLEQGRLTLEGRIFRHLSWFAGPSLNLLIVPFTYPEPGFLSLFDPWSIYESTSGISYIKMWPGIQGGIRF